MVVPLIVGLVVTLGILGGAFVFLKRQASGSVGAERDQLLLKVTQSQTDIETALANGSKFAPKAQLDSLVQRAESIQAEIQNEKETLKAIEEKLDKAQKTVEEVEGRQQELKSSKEEDELRVQELLTRYSEISNESISLEQRLAASMKNLDSFLAELTLTQDQRDVLEEFQASLVSAGSRLRDLLTEYAAINERLSTLKGQHKDLEDEYTKLVEQQLGE